MVSFYPSPVSLTLVELEVDYATSWCNVFRKVASFVLMARKRGAAESILVMRQRLLNLVACSRVERGARSGALLANVGTWGARSLTWSA